MIQVDRLTKYFGDRAATRDLSFGIDPGSVVGFLGLNGGGKTTTLRMLALWRNRCFFDRISDIQRRFSPAAWRKIVPIDGKRQERSPHRGATALLHSQPDGEQPTHTRVDAMKRAQCE